ncbi:Fc.00g039530.m01.CDS01 [Cosmosporella sp. VM-42]
MALRMVNVSYRLVLFVLLALNTGVARAFTSTVQFKEWYPRYGHIFETIKNENCSEEYQNYLTGFKNHSNIDVMGGGGIFTALTQPLVSCILKETSEFIKGSMTGAQVLLGVMLTVLALLGASTDEMAMLTIVGKRPLLTLLLSIGSPSAYISRAFDYTDPADILSKHPNRLKQWRPSEWRYLIPITIAEYGIAAAAATNVATISWELGIRCISLVGTDTIYLPLLWACIGILVQMAGAVVLRLRLRGWRDKSAEFGEQHEASIVLKENEMAKDANKRGVPLEASAGQTFGSFLKWIRNIGGRLGGICRTEFVPSAATEFDVHIITFLERKIFLVAAWLLSTIMILHIVSGTLVYASLTFIGTQDAIGVVSRYIGSVAVCRVLLMYELAGLRESCQSIDGTPDGRENSESQKGSSQTSLDQVTQLHQEGTPKGLQQIC